MDIEFPTSNELFRLITSSNGIKLIEWSYPTMAFHISSFSIAFFIKDKTAIMLERRGNVMTELYQIGNSYQMNMWHPYPVDEKVITYLSLKYC